MGFSTAAVFAMLFAVSMAAVVGLFTAQAEYRDVTGDAAGGGFERHTGEVRSDIEITKVTYSGGAITITVNNTGNVALDISYVYLMINDAWIPEESYTITPTNGYWEPTESIAITYATTQTNATVKVVVETGIEDRYEFVV